MKSDRAECAAETTVGLDLSTLFVLSRIAVVDLSIAAFETYPKKKEEMYM